MYNFNHQASMVMQGLCLYTNYEKYNHKIVTLNKVWPNFTQWSVYITKGFVLNIVYIHKTCEYYIVIFLNTENTRLSVGLTVVDTGVKRIRR